MPKGSCNLPFQDAKARNAAQNGRKRSRSARLRLPTDSVGILVEPLDTSQAKPVPGRLRYEPGSCTTSNQLLHGTGGRLRVGCYGLQLLWPNFGRGTDRGNSSAAAALTPQCCLPRFVAI